MQPGETIPPLTEFIVTSRIQYACKLFPDSMDNPESVKYKLSSKLVASEVSDETVILDYEAGRYFGLDGVGSFVWSRLQKDGPQSLKDLTELVMAEYAIDEAQCTKDLKALLADLSKNGLIEASS